MTRSKVSLKGGESYIRLLLKPYFTFGIFSTLKRSRRSKREDYPHRLPHTQNQFSRRTSSCALPAGSSTGVTATPSSCPFFAIQRHNRMIQLLPSRKHSPNQAFQPFPARWLFHIVPSNGAMSTFQFALELLQRVLTKLQNMRERTDQRASFT
jgi:hypothetical protein